MIFAIFFRIFIIFISLMISLLYVIYLYYDYTNRQNGVSLLKTTISHKKRIAPMNNDVQEVAREYNHSRH